MRYIIQLGGEELALTSLNQEVRRDVQVGWPFFGAPVSEPPASPSRSAGNASSRAHVARDVSPRRRRRESDAEARAKVEQAAAAYACAFI